MGQTSFSVVKPSEKITSTLLLPRPIFLELALEATSPLPVEPVDEVDEVDDTTSARESGAEDNGFEAGEQFLPEVPTQPRFTHVPLLGSLLGLGNVAHE